MKTNTALMKEDINWKFLGLFTLYLGIFVALVQFPQSLYYEALRFTASAVAYFWKIFSIPVSSVDTRVTFFNFTMEIILECTGVHYAAIFMAAILAFRGHTFSYKTVGLFAGIGAIFLLNLLRVGIIGILGHYYASLFSFVHLYLWQAFFTLFVLLLWIIWVNGKLGLTSMFTKKTLIVLAVASVSFWIMNTYLNYYISLIAYISEIIFPLFSAFMTVPTSVITNGKLIGFIYSTYGVYTETGLYTLNYVVFLSLASVFALSSDKRSFFKKVIVGSGFMIMSHLGLILMDWTFKVSADVTWRSIILWGIALSSMLAPVVSWLCATLLFPVKRRSKEEQNN